MTSAHALGSPATVATYNVVFLLLPQDNDGAIGYYAHAVVDEYLMNRVQQQALPGDYTAADTVVPSTCATFSPQPSVSPIEMLDSPAPIYRLALMLFKYGRPHSVLWAKHVLKPLLDRVEYGLRKGNISLIGFGTYEVRQRAARKRAARGGLRHEAAGHGTACITAAARINAGNSLSKSSSGNNSGSRGHKQDLWPLAHRMHQ